MSERKIGRGSPEEERQREFEKFLTEARGEGRDWEEAEKNFKALVQEIKKRPEVGELATKFASVHLGRESYEAERSMGFGSFGKFLRDPSLRTALPILDLEPGGSNTVRLNGLMQSLRAVIGS